MSERKLDWSFWEVCIACFMLGLVCGVGVILGENALADHHEAKVRIGSNFIMIDSHRYEIDPPMKTVTHTNCEVPH